MVDAISINKKILLLSIDGGGVRGKAVATFLSLLEKDIGMSIYDTFDLFGGTSTGAVLILGITANKYTAENIANLYNATNLSRIFTKSFWSYIPYFGAKYKSDGKRIFFEEIFTDKRYLGIQKSTLITAYDFINSKIVVFKSSGGSDSMYNPLVAEVADATSAAPTYFPSVITKEAIPRNLIDGGIAANNPSLCLISEALLLGHSLSSIYLLSFGTGYVNIKKEPTTSKNWGQISWINNGLVDDLMLGDSSMVEYQCQTILGKNYLRINGPLNDVDSALDNISTDNLNKLDLLGKSWYNQYKHEVIEFLNSK